MSKFNFLSAIWKFDGIYHSYISSNFKSSEFHNLICIKFRPTAFINILDERLENIISFKNIFVFFERIWMNEPTNSMYMKANKEFRPVFMEMAKLNEQKKHCAYEFLASSALFVLLLLRYLSTYQEVLNHRLFMRTITASGEIWTEIQNIRANKWRGGSEQCANGRTEKKRNDWDCKRKVEI